MACPNPLYHLWFFNTQRTNLYYLTFIAILCSFFYLIGIWTHSTTITIPITSSSADGAATQCSLQPLIATRSASIALDFRAHHMAADPPPTAARAIHLPPCDAKLSEYTPCEDAKRSLKFDRGMLIYRERHCPEPNEVLKCRVPAPYGYTAPFRWPESRENVWYANVPHKWLTFEKKKQNWVRFEKDRFKFPGGGTMFPNGADAYIDDISRLINLEDGSIRTAIDTGCGACEMHEFLTKQIHSLERREGRPLTGREERGETRALTKATVELLTIVSPPLSQRQLGGSVAPFNTQHLGTFAAATTG